MASTSKEAEFPRLKRLSPALWLLLGAPLLAEFLLGDYNLRQVGYLGIFVPLYGASALLVREITRRTQRGWPTMVMLALVYAMAFEGYVNQTLFNPNYAGQHLLAYGFLPELGISLNYTTYILTLHTVWSLCSPIAVAEALAGPRWEETWLDRKGILCIGVLSLLGLTATGVSSFKAFHFLASPLQLAMIGGLMVTCAVLAFSLFERNEEAADSTSRAAPSFWIIALATFVLSSVFQLWFHYAPGNHLDPWLGLAGFVAVIVLALTTILRWSNRRGWGPLHTLAAATGPILTYGWFGLRRLVGSGHTALGVPTTTFDIITQVLLLAGFLWIIATAYRRQRRISSAG